MATPKPRAKKSKSTRDTSTALEVVKTYRGGRVVSDPRQAPVDKPLTEQQRAFVKEWASGETISSASARAGISHSSYAWRLAQMPNVLAAYHAEKKRFEEAAGMTRKKVMDGLIEAVELAKLMAEPQAMVAGWREIGRMCGYYEPVKHRVDVTVTAGAMHRLEQMSDADLLKMIYQPVAEAMGLPDESQGAEG